MKRVIFKATIFGADYVKRTGMVRTPTGFRIRVYAGGDTVITTRGKLRGCVGSLVYAEYVRDMLASLEDLEYRSALSRRAFPKALKRWDLSCPARSVPVREELVETTGPAVFKATISGRELVAKTEVVRVPDSFRIRVYDDGDAVITTRGKLGDEPDRQRLFGKDPRYSVPATLRRLAELEKLSRQTAEMRSR